MITKGKKYIVFGNFPDPNIISDKMSEKLGIECIAFLSNTDNVSLIPYEEEDTEKIKMENQNKLLKKEISRLKNKLFWFQK